jgi:pyrimidine operon attenuation protein / uracil phosphoribosyltransferase
LGLLPGLEDFAPVVCPPAGSESKKSGSKAAKLRRVARFDNLLLYDIGSRPPRIEVRSLSCEAQNAFEQLIDHSAGTNDTITRPMRIVEKTQLMSGEEIDRTLQRLAHEIVEKSGGTKHLALIGIVRRGVPLAQRIAQAMRGIDGVNVPVGVLDITLYRDDLSKVAPQAVLRSSDIPFGVDNMDLVLVDDVLYTGRTIRAAMNGIFDLGRPKRVRLCVLIDRGHREMPIEAQYTGRQVQTSDTEIIEVRLREIDKEERVVLVDRVA